jgi:hypothetical protein
MKITTPESNSFREFEVGKLAKDCPFLLEIKEAFASKVFKFYFIFF